MRSESDVGEESEEGGMWVMRGEVRTERMWVRRGQLYIMAGV